MTEVEFQEILQELHSLVRITKIAGAGETWLALGQLFDGASVDEIQNRLSNFPVRADVQHEDGTVWLKVSDKPSLESRKGRAIVIPKTNLVLFLLTVMTTLMAGTMLEGGNPFASLSEIWKGVPFSISLMLILGCHEFGHYIYAKKHHVDVTLPYFIPFPPFLTLIGTLGAVIRIKSPIHNRRALLDIGAAGPIAGFLVAVPVLFIGLTQSQVVMLEPGSGLILGDSLLMKFASAIVFPALAVEEDIMLNSVAFAGWIGLLVTMLNLLPFGQLDGGHIGYAIFGERHNKMAKWLFLGLLSLGFLSLHWLIWAGLVLILMRTVKHPPILDMQLPLSLRERLIGITCLVIFIVCFVPVPFS